MSARGPGRDLSSGVRLDEVDNGHTGPESKREFQLVKALAVGGSNDLRLLLLRDRSLLWPALPLCSQSGIATAFMSDEPLLDRLA